MTFLDSLSAIRFLKIALFLLFFAEAARQDFLTKTVSDSVWEILFLLLFPTVIFETFLFGFHYFFDILASVLIVFLFSFIHFYLGIFGGADCKAFLLIAVFFPIRFSSSADPFFLSSFFSVFSSFAFSVLVNSLFFAAVFSLSFFLSLFFSVPHSDRFSLKHLLLLKIPFFIPLFFGFLTAAVVGNILVPVF
jgi:Type IV leader peptidase family.